MHTRKRAKFFNIYGSRVTVLQAWLRRALFINTIFLELRAPNVARNAWISFRN